MRPAASRAWSAGTVVPSFDPSSTTTISTGSSSCTESTSAGTKAPSLKHGTTMVTRATAPDRTCRARRAGPTTLGPVPTLGDRVDGRLNNFDVLRFALASTVLISHSYPLTQGGVPDPLADLTNGQF